MPIDRALPLGRGALACDLRANYPTRQISHKLPHGGRRGGFGHRAAVERCEGIHLPSRRILNSRSRTHTGADGRFAFTALPAGKYTLIGSALGYRAQGFHQRGNYFIGVAVGPDLDSESIVFQPGARRPHRRHQLPTMTANPFATATSLCISAPTTSAASRRRRSAMPSLTIAATTCSATSLPEPTSSLCRRALGTRSIPIPASLRPMLTTHARIAEERAPLEVAYPMTFHPAAEESSGASPIVLQPGDQVTADIAVRAVPAVHLRVRTGDAEGTSSAGAGSRGCRSASSRERWCR